MSLDFKTRRSLVRMRIRLLYRRALIRRGKRFPESRGMLATDRRRFAIIWFCLIACVSVVRVASTEELLERVHPDIQLRNPVMLIGDWVPDNVHAIDFMNLPRVPSEHAVVSDVRDVDGVNQHNYLTFYRKRFWLMWSDGPGIEDRVGQRVKFATSDDGLVWEQPTYLTPPPPKSDVDSPYYGQRTKEGFRWIARGFWQREGQLLALAALDEAAGFFGPSLELHAFEWDDNRWTDLGVVFDNSINNFPPQRLPTNVWMMSRRTHDYRRFGVHFLIGGHEQFDRWQSFPVLGSTDGLAAEEPYWWVLPDGHLMALFRDNLRSGYLFRSFSTDLGRTWSKPIRTNFPDARSKFHGLRLSDGRYVLVSNANPRKRDPLVLSISDDGRTFHAMAYLVGGRRVDYPHVWQHKDHLLVAFSGGKQSIEVLKMKIADLDEIQN